jgi:predicted deacylase
MIRSTGKSRLSLNFDLAAPGRQNGDIMLRWSDNAMALGYYPVPVISIKHGDGPTALIIGGTHGDEFEGPVAIMRLAASLTQEDITGQLILIPGLNSPAFQASSRVSPLDGENLNRAFPGDPNGGPTATLAHFIETEIMPHCDAVFDLHSGGKASFFQPCTLATRTKDPDLFNANLGLANAFGLPLIWELGANNDNRSVNSAAERTGIPMIATELGGGGGVDPVITAEAEHGLRNCLVYLGILSGSIITANPRRVEITSSHHSLYAPADGLFDRKISAGDDVVSGQTAGILHFPSEPTRHSIDLIFPEDGFVLAHSNRGILRRGDLIAFVAQDVSELN